MATRRKREAPLKRSAGSATWSTGNVFADLGRRNADDLLMRAELLRRIAVVAERRKSTQGELAALLGLKQPDVSALLNGRFLRRFSTDRLMRFLVALDQDVEIVVKPKPASRAQAHLTVAATG